MCSLNEYLKNPEPCEGDIFHFNTILTEEKVCILSECSLLQSEFTDKLTICYKHREICHNTVQRRRRRTVCDVSTTSSLLCQHATKKTGDRHVTVEMYCCIAKDTGVFIPVGTPICRLCREAILKSASVSGESIPIKENAHEHDEDDNSTITNDTDHRVSGIKVDNSDAVNLTCSKDGFCLEKRKRNYTMDLRPIPEYTEMPKKMCIQNDECLSQPFSVSSSQAITDSQGSEASVMNISRIDSLNAFLYQCNVSPVKTLTNQLVVASERTKKRYVQKARQTISAILDTIAPNEGHLLWDSIIDQSQIKGEDDTLETLKKIYCQAESWQFRRQVLSVIVEQMSFEEALKFIPDLTSWRYYEAKKHAATEGPGLPVHDTFETRDRIDASSLDHFIDYITSSHVIKDLPFGQKTLKLDSGEVITIPNVIRSMSSSALIEQYFQICRDDNTKPLGKSTLYRILTECAASVRKSVEGLDNYVMEGSRAFQTLEEIFSEDKDMKTKLLEAKRYLKAEFKVHLARQTNIKQHCLGFALSAPGCEFQQLCQHEHDQHCQNCVDLDTTLLLLIESATKMQTENKDAIMFKVEKAVEDIKDLQKHLVRSRNQEFARNDIADSLEVNDVMITLDWAMKFLPRRYREGQLDWFAKRGINWHVSVSLIKQQHKLQTLTHLHIFRSQTAQDAATTTAVLTDVVEDLQTLLPNLRNVHVFSDNAGCYKSSLTLSTLRHDIGQKLATYNFSESQNGKGPCDRRAAHAKFVIKRYINEGRDVTTAMDMKKALEKFGEKAYRVRVVDTVLDIDAVRSKENIKNISSFFNFTFGDDGLRMWQAYGIGEGKLISWDSLKPVKNSVQLKVVSDWADLILTDAEEDTAQPEKQVRVPLLCPMEDCIREFKNKTSLEHHLLQGSCEVCMTRDL